MPPCDDEKRAATFERGRTMAYDIYETYNKQKTVAEESAKRQIDVWAQQVAAQKENAKRARDSQLSSSQGMYDNALKTYQADHESSVGKVQEATGQAMQQAYISNQLSQRNIGQQLAAQGRSGGASESALLGIANTYGQTRGGLDTQRNGQIGDLALSLDKQRTAALSARDNANAQYTSEYERSLSEFDGNYATQRAQIEESLVRAQQQIDMQIAQAMQAQAEYERQAKLAQEERDWQRAQVLEQRDWQRAQAESAAASRGKSGGKSGGKNGGYKWNPKDAIDQFAAQQNAKAAAQKKNPPYLLPGFGGSAFR